MINAQDSEVVLASPNGEALIRKTPMVCGGDACIRNSRIMVWLLVAFKRGGMTDEQLLYGYPGLTAEDLAAAWEHYKLHPQEIDAAIRANEEDDD
jgi:uncharacterized protein (DUF433 family)